MWFYFFSYFKLQGILIVNILEAPVSQLSLDILTPANDMPSASLNLTLPVFHGNAHLELQVCICGFWLFFFNYFFFLLEMSIFFFLDCATKKFR